MQAVIAVLLWCRDRTHTCTFSTYTYTFPIVFPFYRSEVQNRFHTGETRSCFTPPPSLDSSTPPSIPFQLPMRLFSRVHHYTLFSSQLCLHLYLLEAITLLPSVAYRFTAPLSTAPSLHPPPLSSSEAPRPPPGEWCLMYFRGGDYHSTYQEGGHCLFMCVSPHAGPHLSACFLKSFIFFHSLHM